MLIAGLAAIALAQAAVIAVWVRSDRSSAPDTGSVVVTSEPTGVRVAIDDVVRGVTPVTLALAPGAHRIAIGPDGALRTQAINVTQGSEASVHFELGPAPAATVPPTTTGSLQISTEPTGAQVLVDGRPRGVAPLSVAGLAPGTHVVTVRDSSRTVSQRVVVVKGAAATLVIAMNAKSQFESGSLEISSPIPVQIRERGSLVGTSDTPRLLLSTGVHRLELTNADLGYRVERNVEINAGRTTSLKVAVPDGVLHINALPWADVWLGTRALGETPIANVSVPLGTYDLLFRHPELGEQRKTVVVRAGAPLRVGIDLRKGQQ